MAHDPYTLRSLRSLRRRLVLGGLLGLGLGSACTYTEIHGGEEACLDDFFECLEDADGPSDIEACEDAKAACLDDCSDGWRGDHDDGDAGAGSDGGGAGSDDGGAGSDDGGTGSDGGAGSDDGAPPSDSGDAGDSGDLPDPACFEIHAACVANATTIAEVDACEVLFDQCLEAEPCDHTCEPVCPDPGVSACLDIYEACATVAEDASAVQGCAAGFDACTGDLDDSACVPQDPSVVDACLEQHALCTQCIDDSEDLWLCKQVFDTCLAG